MLTLYQAKPTVQNCLRPLVRRLAHWGRTPNEITLLAIALSGVAGWAIAQFPESPYPLLALPVVLILRMALNAIDGLLAREHDLTSPLGFVLNEIGDVVADVSLYIPFAVLPHISAHWVVTVTILAILTEFAGILGLVLTQERAYDGPLGKSDRAFLFGGLGLLFGGGLGHDWNWIWPIICGLEVWTIINRLHRPLQEVAPCH